MQLKRHAAQMQLIWNSCVLPRFGYECDDWDVYDWFHNNEQWMFENLLLAGIEEEFSLENHEVEIHLAREFHGEAFRLRREVKGRGYTYELLCVVGEDDRFRYLDFFDFDVMGLRQYEFYLVEVLSLSEHPELTGSVGILPVVNTRAFAVGERGRTE